MPETLYYTGSTTKSFTVASMLKLIEQSSNDSTPLTLKTKVQSLIRDEFVLTDEYATAHITLEDALSHRTGMPRHDSSYGGENQTIGKMIRRLRYLPMTAELREEWQYCNIMFVVVSYVIETLTGSWLGDFFRENIWEPLGMHSTFLSLADAQKADAPLAKGYFWNNVTQEYVEEPWLDSPVVSGAGATISNVLDYAKYLQALLQMNTTILSEASYTELRTPRFISNGQYGTTTPWVGPEMYGLGWMMGNYRGHQVFHHGGSVTGFGALMAYVPTVGNGIGIAAMANSEETSNIIALILGFDILDNILKTPQDELVDFVGVFDGNLRHESEKLKPDNARKRIYPDAPPKDEALPLPLPIESYAGSYWNEGYRNLTVYVDDPPNEKVRKLRVDVLDKTWKHTITFEHISGDYFVGWMHTPGRYAESGYLFTDARAAEFQIGSDGKVRKLGFDYEPSMKGQKIWFTRE